MSSASFRSREIADFEDARKALTSNAAVLIDEVQDALIIRDLQDRICFWNKGAERLYGWRAAEVDGRNVYEVLFAEHPPDFSRQQRDLAETGEWIGELQHVTKARRNIIVESRWKLRRDEFGQPTSVLLVNRDITEKKKLETEILRAQRIETIGKLASSVAHDLNNVLSTMLISIRGLLREHTELKDKYGLESWQISAGHAAQLMSQLLSLAKDVDEEPRCVCVRHLVEETAAILKNTFPASIRIESAIAGDLHFVSGNATQLYQVLLNLCVNARDAMPSGGTLTIEAANVMLKTTAMGCSREGDLVPYVRIRVSDTGTGIPPEIAGKMFEAFYTTKGRDKGTGLGLFTVARIVKNHNGFVNLVTGLNRGTQFAVYLPAEVAY